MPQNPLTNINSKYFIDRVENDIVQLAKTLSIEHSISIDEAKIMARQMIQRRLNVLLTDQEKSGINKVITNTKNEVKNPASQVLYAGYVYELLKTMELM